MYSQLRIAYIQGRGKVGRGQCESRITVPVVGVGLDRKRGLVDDRGGSGGSCIVPDRHIENFCCCHVQKNFRVPDDGVDVGDDETSPTARVFVLRSTQI